MKIPILIKPSVLATGLLLGIISLSYADEDPNNDDHQPPPQFAIQVLQNVSLAQIQQHFHMNNPINVGDTLEYSQDNNNQTTGTQRNPLVSKQQIIVQNNQEAMIENSETQAVLQSGATMDQQQSAEQTAIQQIVREKMAMQQNEAQYGKHLSESVTELDAQKQSQTFSNSSAASSVVQARAGSFTQETLKTGVIVKPKLSGHSVLLKITPYSGSWGENTSQQKRTAASTIITVPLNTWVVVSVSGNNNDSSDPFGNNSDTVTLIDTSQQRNGNSQQQFTVIKVERW